MDPLDIQENEKQFGPLLLALSKLALSAEQHDAIVANYFFMQYTNQGAAYKHVWTREYVCITEAGDITFGAINLKP